MQRNLNFSENALDLLAKFRERYSNCESDMEAIRLALLLGIKPIEVTLQQPKKEEKPKPKPKTLDEMPKTKEQIQMFIEKDTLCGVCSRPVSQCDHIANGELIRKTALFNNEWEE